MITSSLTEIAANGEYEENGGRNVLRTAGDTQEEYRALREGAMFYDCSAYGLFTLRGEGADRFLEKLATRISSI